MRMAITVRLIILMEDSSWRIPQSFAFKSIDKRIHARKYWRSHLEVAKKPLLVEIILLHSGNHTKKGASSSDGRAFSVFAFESTDNRVHARKPYWRSHLEVAKKPLLVEIILLHSGNHTKKGASSSDGRAFSVFAFESTDNRVHARKPYWRSHLEIAKKPLLVEIILLHSGNHTKKGASSSAGRAFSVFAFESTDNRVHARKPYWRSHLEIAKKPLLVEIILLHSGNHTKKGASSSAGRAFSVFAFESTDNRVHARKPYWRSHLEIAKKPLLVEIILLHSGNHTKKGASSSAGRAFSVFAFESTDNRVHARKYWRSHLEVAKKPLLVEIILLHSGNHTKKGASSSAGRAFSVFAFESTDNRVHARKYWRSHLEVAKKPLLVEIILLHSGNHTKKGASSSAGRAFSVFAFESTDNRVHARKPYWRSHLEIAKKPLLVEIILLHSDNHTKKGASSSAGRDLSAGQLSRYSLLNPSINGFMQENHTGPITQKSRKKPLLICLLDSFPVFAFDSTDKWVHASHPESHEQTALIENMPFFGNHTKKGAFPSTSGFIQENRTNAITLKSRKKLFLVEIILAITQRRDSSNETQGHIGLITPHSDTASSSKLHYHIGKLAIYNRCGWLEFRYCMLSYYQ
ncbi:uncharacterized protein BYT42DRAFT_641196 [Radiomyces spectabilis]|uniref:uncharacterized protein n=1 Tax=Radiomyces spectabilis TaxID=64574 RepID=UPI002220A19F|nr:uncharacterized protein BYT42DRAFT_641196 [Radiomyces spectabilis]KAI8394118.1 hypothetical protein BYT42DRAFT_641196 [Radiomyces spectabilis]